jgi:hypothetical protein
MSKPGTIISNRKFIDNDTAEVVDNYIDDMCADPDFLCKNVDMCGKNTSIYTNVENVKEICKEIEEAKICENDIKECIVRADNDFDTSQMYVSTSFLNIIIPIPNAFDNDGNQKFIRLPPLSASKKEDSLETCSICKCMDRFAKSPGGGNADGDTSPRQNECIYDDNFEYYYYPVYVEEIRNNLPNPPPLMIKKYNILNKNIIKVQTSDDLDVCKLNTLLKKNGLSDFVVNNFITKVLYKHHRNIKELIKKLNECKTDDIPKKGGKESFGNTTPNSLLILLISILILFFICKK